MVRNENVFVMGGTPGWPRGPFARDAILSGRNAIRYTCDALSEHKVNGYILNLLMSEFGWRTYRP
jgi:hypothetical protein